MRLALPAWLPYAALGVAVLGGVGMCRARDAARVEQGRQEERAKVAHAAADSLARALDSLKHRQPRVDTTYLRAAATSTAARDSLRLARSAADSLARLLAIRDADSVTITTCSVARLTCEERAITAERLADARLRELAARAATPVLRRRWGVGGTVGFGATYDLGTHRLATGPSATVGVSWNF